MNRQRQGAELERAAAESELAAVTRKLDGLIDAIAEGFRAPGLQQRLDDLERRKAELETGLAAPAPSPVRLHPNLAQLYRVQTQLVRQELVRRVDELDSSIEEAIGESSQLRQNSAVLKAAVDGLLKALDTVQFYNAAAGAVGGSGSAALSFRLLPLLPPATRARRLLSLTLRDLGRLATGKIPQASEGWEGRVYSRLSVLPDSATPLQRSELLAPLSVGCEIIRLRNICRRLDLGSGLDEALEALAEGSSSAAVAKLINLDDALMARPGAAILGARASILVLSEALTEHAAYFDAGAPV